MTVLETVLFAASADVKAYVLSEADALGKSWDASRWSNRGQGELRLLEPRDGGNIRGTAKGTGVSNKDKILTNHLVHPESVLKEASGGKGRLLWVQDALKDEGSIDTCLELTFEDKEKAIEFERQYNKCQTKMEQLHSATASVWKTQSDTSTTATPQKSPITTPKQPEKKPAVKQTDPNNLYPSSSEEEDDGEESSECSEISLSDTDEEYEASQKKMIIPSFKDQSNMWKCMSCTTPNPETATKCLCCETDRNAEPPSQNQSKSVVVNFASKTEEKPKTTFNFAAGSTESTEKPSFNFAAGTTTTTEKPTFSFAAGSAGSGGAFNFGKTDETTTKPFSFAAAAKDEKTDTTTEPKKEEPKKEEPKTKASPYPPTETMKKVEQPFAPKPKSSPYPPMETMKKVEQPFAPKPKASAYPPMETMKKVDQPFAAKPKASPYPPAETMKKVDQPFAAKPKASPYPPAETMKKVDQPFAAKKEEKAKTDSEPKKQGLFGLSSAFGSSNSQSPFAAATGGEANDTSPGLFKSSSTFGQSGGGLFSATKSADKGSELQNEVKAFYEKYNPEKVTSVASLMVKFEGKEQTLVDNLCKKYSVSEQDKAKLFPSRVQKSVFGSTNAFSDLGSGFGSSGFSGFSSSLGSSLNAPATPPVTGGVTTEPRDSGPVIGSEDEDSSDGEATTEQRSLGGGFNTPATAFASPTLNAPSSSVAATTPSTTFGASNTFGASTGGSVTFGQSSVIGSSTGGFGITPSGPATPQEQPAFGSASFGGSGGGFASFADNKGSGGGFASFADNKGSPASFGALASKNSSRTLSFQ